MFFLGSGEILEGWRPRLLNYLCPLHWKHGVLTTGPLWNSLYYFLNCTYFCLHFSSLFFLPFIIWNIQLFIFRSFYLAINFLINTALPASFKFSFMLFAFSFIQIISLSFPLKKKIYIGILKYLVQFPNTGGIYQIYSYSILIPYDTDIILLFDLTYLKVIEKCFTFWIMIYFGEYFMYSWCYVCLASVRWMYHKFPLDQLVDSAIQMF